MPTLFIVDGPEIQKVTFHQLPLGIGIYKGADEKQTSWVTGASIECAFRLRGGDFTPLWIPPMLKIGRLALVKGTLYCIELPPGVYKTTWQDDDRDTVRGEISLPWTYLFADGYVSSNVQVFFRREKLESVNDTLYITTLPNTFAGFTICLGRSYPTIYEDPHWLDEVVTLFLNAAFTGHGCYRRDGNTPINMTEWAERTRDDPQYALKVEWPEAYTLGEYFEWLNSEYADAYNLENALCHLFD